MVLWGNKVTPERLGFVTLDCPKCKTECSFAVDRVRKKLHIYYISLFEYSNVYYVTCLNCQNIFEVPKALKTHINNNLINQDEFASKFKDNNHEYTIPDNELKSENTLGFQYKSKEKNNSTYVCMCCGAVYNETWWFTYNAKDRCCSGLPMVEQEELWDNRLYKKLPLKLCVHGNLTLRDIK